MKASQSYHTVLSVIASIHTSQQQQNHSLAHAVIRLATLYSTVSTVVFVSPESAFVLEALVHIASRQASRELRMVQTEHKPV